MFLLLFVGLLAGLQSLEVAQCQNLPAGIYETSHCYNTSSGKTCFTTLLASNNRPVRQTFIEASNWCKVHVPGSSLIVVNSLENLKTIVSFIGRRALANETIVLDAQKLSASESLRWSWVNGHQTIANDVTHNVTEIHDGGCVEANPGQSVTFCLGGVWTVQRFICEYSESISDHSFQSNNKYYVASEESATWYDARNKCLRLGGDLASIANLQTIEDWSQLKEIQNKKIPPKRFENQRYWIGLHRNKWIWKSTGAAITYTNWEGGFPGDVNDQQCICINPQCRSENSGTICDYDRKWWACNCDHNYAFACQREEGSSKAVTTKIVGTGEMLSSTSMGLKPSATTPTTTTISLLKSVTPTLIIIIPSVTDNSAGYISKKNDAATETTPQSSTIRANPTTRAASITTTTSTKIPIVPPATEILTVPPSIPVTPTSVTTITDEIARDTSSKTDSTISIPHKPLNHYSGSQTTVVPQLSTEPFNSLNITKLIPIIIVFVAVLFMIVAVIFIIRKRNYDRRNKTPSTTITKQGETVSSAYATVIPGNRPPEDTFPTASPIYAEVEMTQRPANSSNTIYASVQPTSEAIDMGKSVVYAELDKVAVAVSPIYSEPFVPPMSMNNSVYAEPFKLDTKSTATAPVPNHYYNIAAVGQNNV